MKKSIVLDEYTLDGQLKANCPACHEELNSSDLEMYYACPYCGKNFKDNEELNRFIMEPVISSWLQKSNKNN